MGGWWTNRLSMVERVGLGHWVHQSCPIYSHEPFWCLMAVSSEGMDMSDKRPSVTWRIIHVW